MSIFTGQLPASWTRAPIGSRYRVTKKPRDMKIGGEQELPFIPMESVPAGGQTVCNFELRKFDSITSGTYFEAGDVLLSKITPSFENGKQGMATQLPNKIGYGSTELIPLQAFSEDAINLFLFYLLLQHEVRDSLTSKMEGSTGRQRVPESAVRELQVPYPPKAEQEKIAAVLWKLQRAIATQDRLIATTRDLKRSAMHQLFTVGLRGDRTIETDVGPMPASWRATTLGDLCAANDGRIQTGPFGSQLHAKEYLPSGIPVVNPTHLLGNKINHEDVPKISAERASDLARHKLREGDVLFARRGQIGRHGFVSRDETSWICGTGCFLIRINDPSIFNEFLPCYFSVAGVVSWLEQNATGAIMPNLNNTVLSRLPIYFPESKSDQQSIAAAVTTIDRKLAHHQKKRTTLNDLFQTLLHKLMTGEIRVADIDIDTSEVNAFSEATT